MKAGLEIDSGVLRRLAGVLPPNRFWLVGGAVRDLLLGRVPTDYDIAVKGNPADFAQALAKTAGRRAVAIGAAGKRIYRVVDQKLVYDFSPVAGEVIEEDLGRRDFTVNAMALSPVGKILVDPFGGRDDLAAGCIRMVSGDVFKRDPVRLLRAFRMAAVFDFTVAADTEARLRRQAGLIESAAGERLRDELFKLLAVERSETVVSYMNHCGLLPAMFPEIAPLAGCLQGIHHQYDVLTHTLLVLSQLEEVLVDPSRWLPLTGLRARESEDCRDPVLLKLAALFHDIGKPATRNTDGGRTHFHGHGAVGSRMAEGIFDRLRLSNRDRKLAGFLIRHHIEPLQLFIARRRGTLTRKGRTRFFIRSGAMTPPLVLLSLADAAGKKTPADERFIAFAQFADQLLGDHFGSFRPKQKEPPLVNGRDLMATFDLSPSPLLGKILSKIEAERLEGRLNSRKDAMNRARELVHLWQNEVIVPKPK